MRPQVQQFSTGSICEFEDGKQRPHLGVVLSVDVSAKKGGAVYQVVDAKDQKHAVRSNTVKVGRLGGATAGHHGLL